MIKYLLPLILSLPLLCKAATPREVLCPTAKEANQLFKNCQIEVAKESCLATFRGVELVLNSPVEGIYGGSHTFHGFTAFKGVEISSRYFVCKYDLTPRSRKMAWVIGSRQPLAATCQLSGGRTFRHVTFCANAHPKKCKIIC